MEDPIGITSFTQQSPYVGQRMQSPHTQTCQVGVELQGQKKMMPMSAQKFDAANSEIQFDLPSQATPIVVGPIKQELNPATQQKPVLVQKKSKITSNEIQQIQNQKSSSKKGKSKDEKNNQFFTESKFWIFVILIVLVTNYLWKKFGY